MVPAPAGVSPSRIVRPAPSSAGRVIVPLPALEATANRPLTAIREHEAAVACADDLAGLLAALDHPPA